MIDYLWETRQALIENFQASLKPIRLLMGFSVAELADYIGVTRQTINNLETGKTKMSAVQFLSLAAVVDNYIAANGEMYQAIETILDGNSRKTTKAYQASFSGFSLIKRWFLLFEKSGHEITADQGTALQDYQVRQMVHGYKIFLDDTVLLSEDAEAFVTMMAEHLLSENAMIIVPLRSIERVQEKTMDSACAAQAVKALRLLNWMQQKNIIQIRGEENDSNVQDTILSVFLKFRGTYRLCLITQDSLFADRVLRVNETRDSEGFPIAVGYIAEGGQLVMYAPEADTQNANPDDSLPIPAEVTFEDTSDLSDAMCEQEGDRQETSNDVVLTDWEYL